MLIVLSCIKQKKSLFCPGNMGVEMYIFFFSTGNFTVSQMVNMRVSKVITTYSNYCRTVLKEDEWKVSLFLRPEIKEHILIWPVIRVYLNDTYSVRLCANWQSCGCAAHKPTPPMSSSQPESGCSRPKGRDKQRERD